MNNIFQSQSLFLISQIKRIIQKIQMDNYKSQQMQNWKKTMIMDPLLNNLFDNNIDVKDFIHQKILPLQHQQIVHIYTILSSIKHAISKQIQKEVEIKHQLIENSFQSKQKITLQLKLDNQNQIQNNLKKISDFNGNYKKVQENINRLENINKIIRFSKALQKFKINCRLLKTFMKDHMLQKQSSYKQSQFSSNKTLNSTSSTNNITSQSSLNLPKISKLLKQLNDLITKFDFTGIKYYQNEKQFISNSKGILYSLTQKQLNKSMQKYLELIQNQIKLNYSSQGYKISKNIKPAENQKLKVVQQQIRQKFQVLKSINKLKQFIIAFTRKILKQTADMLKVLFQMNSIQQFRQYFFSTVFITIVSHAKINLRLEEILVTSMFSKALSNQGVPNLFQKFIQKVVSYFNDLIKWNQDQDSKQLQKKRNIQTQKRKTNSSTNKEQNQSHLILGQIRDIFLAQGSKNQRQKHPLVYKYPVLLNGLSILVNKIHEEVLLFSQYNAESYQFYLKKEQFIKILVPVSNKFHKIFTQICSFLTYFSKLSTQNDQNSANNQNIISEFKINAQQKIECLRTIYERMIGIGFQPNTICQISQLIEQLNQKVINEMQLLVNSFASLKQIKKQVILKILEIINKKQVFMNYTHLGIALDHLKRIKNIEKALNQNPLT